MLGTLEICFPVLKVLLEYMDFKINERQFEEVSYVLRVVAKQMIQMVKRALPHHPFYPLSNL